MDWVWYLFRFEGRINLQFQGERAIKLLVAQVTQRDGAPLTVRVVSRCTWGGIRLGRAAWGDLGTIRSGIASLFRRRICAVRTSAIGIGGPMPQQCERMRLRCRRSVSDGAIRWRASAPKARDFWR